jgi:hypothetical protein
VIYRFPVGQLSCAVVSDGQTEPPLAPPLEEFFTPATEGWAADENLLVHAYHMPFPGLGRVERHGRTFGGSRCELSAA